MKTKTVVYFNKEYTIPSWVNYIAIDSDNRIVGHSRKPIFDRRYREWNDDTGGMLTIIGIQENPFIDPESSLKSI